MRTRWYHCGSLLAASLMLASCEQSVSPTPTGELNLSVVSGDLQEGAAGAELPNPLVVKVTKPDGRPVRGQILNFRVVSGGGSVFAGTALTDERGIAQERWTLGTSGVQKVEVRAVSTSTGAPQVFATFTAAIVCHDCWSIKTPLTVGRQYPVAAGINGRLYVAGGRGTSGDLLSVESYDPSTESWSIVGDPMESARYGAAAAALNGQLYVVGGGGTDGRLNGLASFDPVTGHWTTHAPPPTLRVYGGAVAINGIFYFVGGTNSAFSIVGTLDAYDPATNSWTQKAPMPTPRRVLSVVAVNGILYAIGGEALVGEGLQTTSVVEAYDPANDTWATKASLPAGRKNTVAGVIGGKIYVASGVAGCCDWATTSYAYDPGTNSWSARSAVLISRSFEVGGVLDGLFYVVGGYNNEESFLRAVEAYKP